MTEMQPKENKCLASYHRICDLIGFYTKHNSSTTNYVQIISIISAWTAFMITGRDQTGPDLSCFSVYFLFIFSLIFLFVPWQVWWTKLATCQPFSNHAVACYNTQYHIVLYQITGPLLAIHQNDYIQKYTNLLYRCLFLMSCPVYWLDSKVNF